MNKPMYCVNHPRVETYLRCNRCGRPICSKCAVPTPVGYRCKDCISAHQQTFYAGFRPVYYLVAAAVALPLALIAGWLIPGLGWFVIVLGPVAGSAIANAAHWVIRRRRGPYIWLLVCGCIIVGALIPWLISVLFVSRQLFLSQSPYITGIIAGLLWRVVYLVAAVGTAYAWLRPGRRG